MLGILSIFDRIIIVYLESRVNFNHRDRQLGSRLDSRLGYRLFTSKSIESNEFLFSLTFKSTWKTPSCLIVDSLIGNEGKCGRSLAFWRKKRKKRTLLRKCGFVLRSLEFTDYDIVSSRFDWNWSTISIISKIGKNELCWRNVAPLLCQLTFDFGPLSSQLFWYFN